ncbi:hypothetical protein QFC24_003083 [Naganishia onofrii]|uniref:Uncharacterized protein n=1 Tax=Naganishia onofrii TaxID=1851511 RepID=A0ACC2XM69_9TREE|nr:hypothetical protein QFC24_003083 [Naganishia onofrii]
MIEPVTIAIAVAGLTISVVNTGVGVSKLVTDDRRWTLLSAPAKTERRSSRCDTSTAEQHLYPSPQLTVRSAPSARLSGSVGDLNSPNLETQNILFGNDLSRTNWLSLLRSDPHVTIPDFNTANFAEFRRVVYGEIPGPSGARLSIDMLKGYRTSMHCSAYNLAFALNFVWKTINPPGPQRRFGTQSVSLSGGNIIEADGTYGLKLEFLPYWNLIVSTSSKWEVGNDNKSMIARSFWGSTTLCMGKNNDLMIKFELPVNAEIDADLLGPSQLVHFDKPIMCTRNPETPPSHLTLMIFSAAELEYEVYHTTFNSNAGLTNTIMRLGERLLEEEHMKKVDRWKSVRDVGTDWGGMACGDLARLIVRVGRDDLILKKLTEVVLAADMSKDYSKLKCEFETIKSLNNWISSPDHFDKVAAWQWLVNAVPRLAKLRRLPKNSEDLGPWNRGMAIFV